MRLVDLLQGDGGHHAVERARSLADVPDENGAPAQGEALDLLVGFGLSRHDDVEGVVLRDGLAAGEGVDAEVVGVEAVDGEAVGSAAGAGGAGNGGEQAARVEGRRHVRRDAITRAEGRGAPSRIFGMSDPRPTPA